MSERTYLNFDVSVSPAAGGGYQARIASDPVGQVGPVPVSIPFSGLEIDNFLLRIGRPRRGITRSLQSPEGAAVRSFGSALFDAVFRDELRAALRSSLDAAEAGAAGLRVRLRLTDAPELVDLPWEYLYDRDAHRFVALSEWTPLVRYLELPGRVRPLAVRPPMRLLVMVSSPADLAPLDVEGEWNRLDDALGALVDSGRLQVDRVATGRLTDLQRQLRRGEYHVFHYIGHGTFDTNAVDGVLAFEDQQSRAQLVSGTDLGALLHDHRTLRLVVLNSCEGARSGRTDPYSGTAQSLVRQGIPAVLAMQFEITDEAAITVAHSLYEAVADGYPLDAAVAEARKAVKNQPNPVEWGTPVLYLRAEDARIFDVPRSGPAAAAGEPAPAPEVEAPLPEAEAAAQVPATEDVETVESPPTGDPLDESPVASDASPAPATLVLPGTPGGPPERPAPTRAGRDEPPASPRATEPAIPIPVVPPSRPGSPDRDRRRRGLLVGLVAGLIVLGAVAAVFLVNRSAVVTVDVPGTQAWVDAQVACSPGRVIDVSATGSITHSPNTAAVGPAGDSTAGLRQFNLPGLGSANHAALVGSLDRQEPFFVVGPSRSVTCQRAGQLFLGINDVGVTNNSGRFTATVTPR